MIQSNAKSLLDTTAMLYKKTPSSRHDVCLDQRSFKCKIGEIVAIFFYVGAKFKGALSWYGKLTWESAHAWILKILCYLIVWGITLIFMVRLSFYAIPLLIYDVMNDITIIP